MRFTSTLSRKPKRDMLAPIPSAECDFGFLGRRWSVESGTSALSRPVVVVLRVFIAH